MTLKNTKKLAKFLSYILGRRPDEFGLVPMDKGYFNLKELLKALNEEQGWRHIRVSHLKEVALTIVPSPIEFNNKNLIRACERTQLPQITTAVKIPKLLYIAIRSRAYPAAIEKGLKASSAPYLILSSEIAMAQKIGQRRDGHPVLLTVQVTKSIEKGTRYQKFGETLFLADIISPDTFTGPPLPKEKTPLAKSKKTLEATTTPKTPGSYFPDLPASPSPKPRRRKEIEWKKNRRRERNHKNRQQS